MQKILAVFLTLFISGSASAAQYNVNLDCGKIGEKKMADLIRKNNATDLGFNYYLLKGQLTSLYVIRRIVSESGAKTQNKDLPNLGHFAEEDLEKLNHLIPSCEKEISQLKTAILQKSINCDAKDFIDLDFSPITKFNCEIEPTSKHDQLLSQLTNEQIWQLSAFEYGKFSAYGYFELADFKTPEFLADVYTAPAIHCHDLSSLAWIEARFKQPVAPFCRK